MQRLGLEDSITPAFQFGRKGWLINSAGWFNSMGLSSSS